MTKTEALESKISRLKSMKNDLHRKNKRTQDLTDTELYLKIRKDITKRDDYCEYIRQEYAHVDPDYCSHCQFYDDCGKIDSILWHIPLEKLKNGDIKFESVEYLFDLIINHQIAQTKDVLEREKAEKIV